MLCSCCRWCMVGDGRLSLLVQGGGGSLSLLGRGVVGSLHSVLALVDGGGCACHRW